LSLPDSVRQVVQPTPLPLVPPDLKVSQAKDGVEGEDQ
jgi:hypothetical protein